ncbi:MULTISPECIES: WD40 repeat domain-containing serine/threonine protein kinase [Streptomyces violaceusniger group]|uniref:WD40 repeat domain-containing serine/threonine protein kinase n=1 Tax=Streptomyces violaceusniger group TaxID=2839105 RepID=UPI0023EA4EAD|nr:serine/threonine-protein kinase [Streptomyces rhizosphaericus]
MAGRYRLEGVLGRGGMGVVWRAVDELIGRSVAVKELRAPEGLSTQERAVVAERALREARSAGRINHPGVVAIHDVVPATAEDDAVYIVMELVKGASLADVLQRQGALPEQRVAVLGARTLEALDAAHAIGLVHRDVKPSNILTLPGDEVKLVDFGIAHAADDTRLTRHGVAGSTGYMAPELFEGDPPSPASDLWSLGATLFHALKGSGPFDRPSTAATLRAILQDDLPPLDSGSQLSELIAGLLTRDTAHRITSRQAATLLEAAATATPGTAGTSSTKSATTTQDTDGHATWEEQPTTAGGVKEDWEHEATNVRSADSLTQETGVTGSADLDGAAKRPRRRLAAVALALTLAVAIVSVSVHAYYQSHRDDPEHLGDAKSFGNALAMSPDGKILASERDPDDGDDESYTDLWDVGTQKEIAALPGPDDHGSWVRDLQFSPDGTTLASANESRYSAVTLWDVATHKGADLAFRAADYNDSTPHITSVEFSPDGSTLASVNEVEDDYGKHWHTITLWNVKSRRSVVTIKENAKDVTAVTFSADGKTLSGVDKDGNVHLWSDPSGRSVTRATSQFVHPWVVKSANDDYALQLRDPGSGAILKTLHTDVAGGITGIDDWAGRSSLAVAWGGRSFLAVGGDRGDIEIWRTDTGKRVREFDLDDPAEDIALSSDGRFLICGSIQGLLLWKTGLGT